MNIYKIEMTHEHRPVFKCCHLAEYTFVYNTSISLQVRRLDYFLIVLWNQAQFCLVTCIFHANTLALLKNFETDQWAR